MSVNALKRILPFDFNKPFFILYIITVLVLLLLGLAYMLYKGKYLYMSLVLGAPFLIWIVTQPKLAVLQFICFLFYNQRVFEDEALLVADLSGFIVIVAALLDFLLSRDVLNNPPKLTLNFLSLLLVIFLAGAFGLNPEAAIRPFGRILLLLVIFLSIYRLSKKFTPQFSINAFFIIAVVNSVFVLERFIMSGGVIRSFGFAPVIFDELALLGLVIGVVKFIWSDKKLQMLNFSGVLIIFFALLSTQSRAPIMFGLIMTVAILVLSARRARLLLETGNYKAPEISILTRVRSRPGLLILGVVGAFFLALVLSPGLYTPISVRFEELLSLRPSKSLLLRIVLWKTAFTTFLDHPFLGIGPGLFTDLQYYYDELRLHILYFYIRGLSAHNMLLHYMAETGLVGAVVLLSLFVNLTRLGRQLWRSSSTIIENRNNLAIYALSLTFLLTTVLEAGWMWGQTGLIFAFFAAVISRSCSLQSTSISKSGQMTH